jgi:hypothetical protein
MEGHQKGATIVGGPAGLLHEFVKIDAVGYGFFEVNDRAVGTGAIRSDDLILLRNFDIA